MLAVNKGGRSESPSVSSRSMMSKTHPSARRRRSKGTIAGFAFGQASGTSNVSQAVPEVNGDSAGSSEQISGNAMGGQGNQPQHASDSSTAGASKPSHSARLALLCCQNAIRMGARTQLGLCPPGRARRGLQAALRQRSRTSRSLAARRAALQSTVDAGGYFGLDKMVGSQSLDDYIAQEEDYLMNTNTFDVESDEEASSGDEDELNNIDDLLKEDSAALDDEKKYINLREPLFTPIGAESSLSSPGGASMAAGGAGSGKLPFNRRKLRYFDAMNASDKMAARAYLQQEVRKSKQREALLLSKHLKRKQRQERRRIKQDRGEPLDETDVSDQENEDPREKALLAGVAQFEQPMTPSISAALLIESLLLNPVESLEGMAKCYDGIVAAGVALLDSNVNDPTSPSNDKQNALRSRSEIMAALAPLLITSLEQPAGDTIVHLAKLRRMCGTPRYQRRFIQRVAPALVRPPRGAVWCLRHQNDMEPILAAVELIFDSASEIFTKGWYDRGQLLLADSKRAETLNTAAMQLRNLSTAPGDGFTLGFAGHGHHGMWKKSKSFKAGSGVAKDGSKGSSDHLAEWEVIAVDRQIRISISNIMSTDWSRVVVQSRDNDHTRTYHRSRTSGGKRPSVLPQSSSGDMSPKAVVASPHSPARPSTTKTPISLSPHSDAAENSYTNPFASNIEKHSMPDRSASPQGAPATSAQTPLSPSPPSRSGVDDIDSRLFPQSANTPPRSPNRDGSDGPPTSSVPAVSPMSPRKKPSSGASHGTKESISNPSVIVPNPTQVHPQYAGDKERAPLSPSSVGPSAASDMVPHRPVSSASSIASTVTAGSQPAHYRMLTSTAAERKRTVAACRALRAQITRFEDAFIQLHGRPPKGAAERAPLATTYAQYREWKRAIRADAACRIQALFRGARSRWILLRSNNPRVTRVIMARAGRLNYSERGERLQASGTDTVLNQLSIPAEIGDPDSDRSMTSLSGSIVPLSAGKGFNDVSNDVFMGSGQSGASQTLPAPQWGNQIVRRRAGGNDRPLHDGFSGSPVPKPFPSASASSASGDFVLLSLAELQARKRELKQQLKQYDMNFARKHGRMPVKAEKEPIRHLYENYNALKSQISMMEQEGRKISSSPVGLPQSPSMLSHRSASSPVGPESAGDDSPGNLGLRGKRKPMKAPSFDSMSASTASTTATSSGATSQDLAALKAEKGRLHQMLRSYEKDFFREHKRQVSSFADIKPVASQYRRYKEIKKAIVALQDKK